MQNSYLILLRRQRTPAGPRKGLSSPASSFPLWPLTPPGRTTSRPWEWESPLPLSMEAPQNHHRVFPPARSTAPGSCLNPPFLLTTASSGSLGQENSRSYSKPQGLTRDSTQSPRLTHMPPPVQQGHPFLATTLSLRPASKTCQCPHCTPPEHKSHLLAQISVY